MICAINIQRLDSVVTIVSPVYFLVVIVEGEWPYTSKPCVYGQMRFSITQAPLDSMFASVHPVEPPTYMYVGREGGRREEGGREGRKREREGREMGGGRGEGGRREGGRGKEEEERRKRKGGRGKEEEERRRGRVKDCMHSSLLS